MQLSGPLLDVTRSAGEFFNEAGNKVVYDFTLLHVLAGREVVKVRLPSDINFLDLPFSKGDTVDLQVSTPPNVKIMFEGVTASAAVPSSSDKH